MKDTRSESMLSKKQVLHMIVGLIEVSDYSLIEQGNILSVDVCSESDIEKIKELASLVNDLYSNFDYASSIEFQRSLDGKSESYKNMKLNMINKPASKQKYLTLFGESICELGEDKRVDGLIGEDQKSTLTRARELVLQIENPW